MGGYAHVEEAIEVAVHLALRFPWAPIMMTHGGQINISGLGQRDAWLTCVKLRRKKHRYPVGAGVAVVVG